MIAEPGFKKTTSSRPSAAAKELIFDAEYLARNSDDFQQQYMGEFVAVSRQQVAAHAKTLNALHKKLAAKGIGPGEALTQFFDDPDRILIL